MDVQKYDVPDGLDRHRRFDDLRIWVVKKTTAEPAPDFTVYVSDALTHAALLVLLADGGNGNAAKFARTPTPTTVDRAYLADVVGAGTLAHDGQVISWDAPQIGARTPLGIQDQIREALSAAHIGHTLT